jgi:DtxR family Mn-dependent transcriptional regulator
MPTVTVENYLKAIYALQLTEGRAKSKAISERLDVSVPSVTSMLQSLASDGMVDYQPYKGVALTAQGRKTALNVIRKHRLIEMFLVNVLDYTWDEVHAEAESLEHAVSNELAARIERFLGDPQFDPHGDPIPTAEGEVYHRELRPLNEVEPGQSVKIARVLDQQPTVLRHLSKLGLEISQEVEVVDILPFDGQMTLAVGPKTVEVSKMIATRLLVAETN